MDETIPPYDGTAAPLLDLVFIDKKGDLQKHCRTCVIRSQDFAEFILASEMGLLPWRHRIYHREFRPPHLEPTNEEREALGRSKVGEPVHPLGQKFMRKVSAIFDERRLLVGHMFWTLDHSNWHFFYFDQRDTSPRRNHWEGGSHIHFINYLWPNRTAQSVWSEFLTGNPKMKGALHVRYLDTV